MRDWPKIKMERIIWHWTGGNYSPSKLDFSHYHFIIDGDGYYRDGVPIENNLPPLRDGYAAHTRNCNSRSIGISCAAMGNATEKNFGVFPLKEKQIETMITLSVALGHFYGIPATPEKMLSHAEVEKTLGIKQAGKWDIAVFPFAPQYKTAKACGDYMRAKIQEGLNVHIAR